MPDFNSCDFIAVAEDLITGPNAHQQSYLRTAAGRAYYSAYGLIRKRLKVECGYIFGNAGKHAQIQDACDLVPNQNLKDLGQWLKNSYHTRIKADYHHEGTANLDVSEVEDSIDFAKAAIEIARNLSLNELRSLQRQIR